MKWIFIYAFILGAIYIATAIFLLVSTNEYSAALVWALLMPIPIGLIVNIIKASP